MTCLTETVVGPYARPTAGLFEELIHHAPLGVYVIDAAFRVHTVNPAAHPIFAGIPAVIGRDFDEVLHILWPRARADRFAALFRHTLESGEPFSAAEDSEQSCGSQVAECPAWHIARIVLPEGGYGVACYVRDISAAVKVRHGAVMWHAQRPTESVLATGVNVSERLRAEQALVTVQRKLEFVMDSMPQKIWTATPDSAIDYLNSQWLEYTGLEFEQIRDWSRTGFIHADDLAHTFASWTHGFATGQLIQIEHRFQRADGEYRWHISRCLPLRNADGAIEMWVGSSTDIHDQKSTANELQQLAIELVAADGRKDEFLAMLSHELRNPLAPISNALQMMQLANTDAPTIETARRIIERHTSHMIRLVDELLDISRISRGLIELRREPVDLVLLLRQAVETNHAAIELAQHALIWTLPTEALYLDADPLRIVQLFGNLVNNATKYTPRGGCIWIAVTQEQDEVVVSIRDTGVGIPAHMLQRVFEMFSQVDHSLHRAAGGLGIGLSFVQRLVALHGGAVTARSEGSGHGSEFVVRLPVTSVTPAPSAEPGRNGIQAAVARRRVLIVDDNRDSADSLTLYLQMVGHDVRAAYDGHEAVEVAASFSPDLILMDIGLPQMNGYEAARRIREQEWGQSMAVVALSGWGQEDAKRMSIESGMNAHLVKPVNHIVLAQLMAELPGSPR